MPDTSPSTQTNILAIAALGFSCASVALGPAGFIPGIVLGFLALRQLRSRPDQSGKGIAISGIIVGFVFAVLFVVVAVIWYMMFTSFQHQLERYSS